MSIAEPSPTTGRDDRTERDDPADRLAVAVVGGGASGVLVAAHLLRAAEDAGRRVRVEVFEPAAELGTGVAYGTTDPDHLLNVPAAGMSAWPDRPTDFVEWAARRGVPLADGFAARPEYARYLRAVLDNARAAAPPGSLVVHPTAAVDVVGDPAAGQRTVVGADRSRCPADLVVLATGWSGAGRGHLPEHPQVIDSPMAPHALDGVPDRGRIVVLGAGLTGIDTALTLLRDAPAREVLLVSRSGELPRAHLRGAAAQWRLGSAGFDRLAAAGPLALADVRAALAAELAAARAAGVAWQAVLEAVKPLVASLWLRLSPDCRREFLREDLRRWDVHRHRMAPVVAERVAAERRAGRLRMVAASATVAESAGRLRVRLAGDRQHLPEGGDLYPVAVVDCRGWGAAGVDDVHGLGRTLIGRGSARADPLGLSLDTTEDGQLRDRRGAVVPGLVAVGPARRAATWESTAIGAIRAQAAAVARGHVGDPARAARGHRPAV